MRNGNDKEAVACIRDTSERIVPRKESGEQTKVATSFDARRRLGPFGPPDALRYPIPKRRKAMSRVKKSRKNATVDLSVQISRTVVKMNHPCEAISISRS